MIKESWRVRAEMCGFPEIPGPRSVFVGRDYLSLIKKRLLWHQSGQEALGYIGVPAHPEGKNLINIPLAHLAETAENGLGNKDNAPE